MAYESSRFGTTQTVAYTGSSATVTNAFGAFTTKIRVVADSACHFLISQAGTAAQTTDNFLPANWVSYVTCNPGEKISAIRAGTDGLVTATSGTLWVTELSA